MITIGKRSFEFVKSGSGTNIVFVPGSFSTSAAWRGIQERLPNEYQFISTSLCGYGETTESRTLSDNSIEHEIEILLNIVEQLCQPVHLVGHSFGGLVCFATALRKKLNIKSITTFEANPLSLLKTAVYEKSFKAVREINRQFEKEYFSGNKDAVKLIIDYWGGNGSFSSMPKVVQDYCRASTLTNILDWRTAFKFYASSDDYQKLKIPCLIVRSELANVAMVQISDSLSKSIPNSKTAIVNKANHFLINSHPSECANLLAAFLEGYN
jgi:pimeloyl-ACP methyl ester carboxylesterase